jgi:hypothetical protein
MSGPDSRTEPEQAVSLLPSEPAVELLAKQIELRSKQMDDVLRRGAVPSARAFRELDHLSTFKARLEAASADRARKLTSIAITAACVAAFTIASMCHVSSARVEVDVRLTGVSFTLNDKATQPEMRRFVPGEWGEIILLVGTNLTDVERVDPPDWPPNATVSLSSAPQLCPTTPPATRAIKLQRLELPRAPVSIEAGVVYGFGQRGLALRTLGQGLATAAFSYPIPVDDATLPPDPTCVPPPKQTYAPQSVLVSGQKMRAELFPLEVARPLTIVRNIDAADVVLHASSESSSILSGTVVVDGRKDGTKTIISGDSLELEGSAYIRELTYQDDALRLRMSVEATKAELGQSHKRTVLPTWLDVLFSRWPNELYSVIVALAGVVIGVWRWWKT